QRANSSSSRSVIIPCRCLRINAAIWYGSVLIFNKDTNELKRDDKNRQKVSGCRYFRKKTLKTLKNSGLSLPFSNFNPRCFCVFTVFTLTCNFSAILALLHPSKYPNLKTC